MAEPKSSARKLRQAERRGEALRLRKAGYTYAQIGAQMNCTDVNAYKLVSFELKRIVDQNRHDAEELRTLELERLDALLFGIWDKASGGNESAIYASVKILERRHKLLGIDAPEKKELDILNGRGLASLLNDGE